MCGIAGSINCPLPIAPVLHALHHRGPDASGQLRSGNVRLLHTRLAIIDAHGGSQPMRRGPLAVSYNGEIYNHLELRKAHGLDCRTGSDTETLLSLYERLGIDCLAELDGMFAFALHDQRTDSLWLARDRVGEKPLYLHQSGTRRLVFASELNALSTVHGPDVDDAAVNAFLGTGLKAGGQTLLQGVEELEPGCWLHVDTQTLARRHQRWFSIEQRFAAGEPKITDAKDALQRVDAALSVAVRRQVLASDLQVGAFLSGGIDSGLVVARAARELDSLATFTVAFDGLFDESPLAQAVAKRYDTHHRVLEVDFSSLADNIDTIIGNYGTPTCDDSIIPVWYVSRAAREHVTVVLTGDGADEQFGGYRRYVPYAHAPLFSASPTAADASASRPLHRRLAQRLADALPAPRRKQSLYNYGHRLLTLASLDGLQRYLASTTMLDARLLTSPVDNASLIDRYQRLAGSDHSHLARLMIMDFDTLLSGGLVTKMDIGAMAHSLEARSPFLSIEMLDLAPRLHDSLKIDGRTTKALLRRLAANYLPDTVVQAPKRGFETPLLDWVDGRLRETIHDRLGAANANVLRYIERPQLRQLLAGDMPGVTPLQRARFLWLLLTTEVWLQNQRRYAARHPAETEPLAG